MTQSHPPVTMMHPAVDAAARDFLNGRISRRDLLRRASAAGAGAVLLTALEHLRAGAQATLAGTPAGEQQPPGWSLQMPANLPTNLAGASCSAVLADPTLPELALVMAATAKFQQATGISVNVVNGPSSTTDRLQTYRQQWAAESSDIDVYQVDVIWPGIIAPFAVDLASATQDVIDSYFPAIVANNTVDDKLVAMPWFSGAGLLYFRTDLLQRYGLQPPATWAELTASAKTIQDGEQASNPQFNGFVWQGAAYEGLTCNGLEWQVANGGGTIVEQDGTVSINNPQAIAAFEQAKGWVGAITPQAVLNYQEPDTLAAFRAGNAAFARQWASTYASSQAGDSPIAGKVGVSLLPKGDGSGARNADTLGGWNLMLSKFSKNQDAATAYIRFMTGTAMQLSLAIEYGEAPASPGVYDDPRMARYQPYIAQLKDVFLTGAVARPSTVTGENYADVSQVYFQQLNAILSGATSPQDGAASMEQQIKQLVEGNGL